MRFRVLGTLQVADTSGAALPIGSARLRRLLALLLVHSGAVVSADRIVDVMWGDRPPVNPTNALHNLVSRLRKMIGDGLLARAPGYVLQVSADEIDAGRFDDLVRQARDAVTADRPDRAAALLDQALTLWGGPAYAEFADEDFARAEAARLDELHVTALEERVDAELALGHHAAAAARAETLTSDHPLRERPHAQLMRALYRGGRQADALAVCRDYRDRLDEELGAFALDVVAAAARGDPAAGPGAGLGGARRGRRPACGQHPLAAGRRHRSTARARRPVGHPAARPGRHGDRHGRGRQDPPRAARRRRRDAAVPRRCLAGRARRDRRLRPGRRRDRHDSGGAAAARHARRRTARRVPAPQARPARPRQLRARDRRRGPARGRDRGPVSARDRAGDQPRAARDRRRAPAAPSASAGASRRPDRRRHRGRCAVRPAAGRPRCGRRSGLRAAARQPRRGRRDLPTAGRAAARDRARCGEAAGDEPRRAGGPASCRVSPAARRRPDRRPEAAQPLEPHRLVLRAAGRRAAAGVRAAQRLRRGFHPRRGVGGLSRRRRRRRARDRRRGGGSRGPVDGGRAGRCHT